MKLYLGLLCVLLIAIVTEAQRPRGQQRRRKNCRQACHNTFNPVCASNGKTFKNQCLLNCSGFAKQCNGPCPCRRAPAAPRANPPPRSATEAPEYEGSAPPAPRRQPPPPAPRRQGPPPPAPRAYQPPPPVYQPPPPAYQPPPPVYNPRRPVYRPRPPPPTPAPTPAPTQPPFVYDPFFFMFNPFQPVFVPTPAPVYAPTPKPPEVDMKCFCGPEKDPVCTIDGEEYDNSCEANCKGKLIACENKCPCL